MSTLGWGAIAIAFLLLVAAINNSWQSFIDIIRGTKNGDGDYTRIEPHLPGSEPQDKPDDPSVTAPSNPPLAMASAIPHV